MFRVVTIGGYGFTEETFLDALRAAGVDTFVDVRQRRGMRGSRYAFLNSRRLQEMLAREGIRYLHLKRLAPTDEVRRIQKDEDSRLGQAKRARSVLSPAFVAAYRDLVLARQDPRAFAEEIGPGAKTVALFCVEKEPAACHRSLVAEWLARHLGVEVEHVKP